MNSRIVTLCLAALFFTSIGIAADDAPTLKKVIPTNDTQFARAFSEDRQAATLLFDNLQISTEAFRHSLPNVVTKKFTFVMQPESMKDVLVTQDIRGFVSLANTGKAALLIQSGGKSTLVDLKEAIKSAEGNKAAADRPTYQAALKLAKDAGFDVGTTPMGSNDFFQRVETCVPAGKPLQITVLLLVEALSGDETSNALLTIDTIDLEVKVAPEKK